MTLRRVLGSDVQRFQNQIDELLPPPAATDENATTPPESAE